MTFFRWSRHFWWWWWCSIYLHVEHYPCLQHHSKVSWQSWLETWSSILKLSRIVAQGLTIENQESRGSENFSKILSGFLRKLFISSRQNNRQRSNTWHPASWHKNCLHVCKYFHSKQDLLYAPTCFTTPWRGTLTRLSWAAYNYAAAPTFMNNNRPQHQELGSLLSGEMWVGSLTSLTNQYRKNKGEGDLHVHVLYPKILEHETIFRCKSKGSTFSTVTLYFKTLSVAPVWDWSLNPWSPTRDIERISPYTISTISSRQVMRIKKNTNQGIIGWSNSKFSKLTSYEL